MHTIFIIEDDQVIANELKSYFVKWGYSVFLAESFDNIISDFKKYEPSIILLDISLPHFNGFHWCQELRKFSKVPIIFISSSNDAMSMVMAMNMGADDFINKPFDLNVLNAKVQALLRRTYDFKVNIEAIYHNNIIFNSHDATIKYNDENVELTKNENRILSILFENVGKIVPREIIMQKLWKTDEYIDDNTLTVNINRLRKKLEEIDITDLIITKKNEGYIINEE